MEITSLKWEFIDWFEFIVVASCFLTITHRRLHTFWYAANAPIPSETVLLIAGKACMWAALLSAYLMLRVDTLIIAGLLNWPVIFLIVTLMVLILAAISSIMVHSGLWGKGKDRLFMLIAERSDTLVDRLRTLFVRYAQK